MTSLKEYANAKWIILYVIWYILVMWMIMITHKAYDSIVDIIRDNKEPNTIWSYEKISPVWTFYVWEPMWFASSRWSIWTFNISMLETLRCEDNQEYRTTMPVWTFVLKEWSTKNKKYRYWEDYNYLPTIPWVDCTIESCQELDYYWQIKKQCFMSDKFDILPAKK